MHMHQPTKPKVTIAAPVDREPNLEDASHWFYTALAREPGDLFDMITPSSRSRQFVPRLRNAVAASSSSRKHWGERSLSTTREHTELWLKFRPQSRINSRN